MRPHRRSVVRTWVRYVLVLAIAACGPEPAPVAPPPAHHAPPAAPFPVWTAALKAEPFALVDDRLLAWDRERDGVVELDATSGREVRFRRIANLRINGVPSLWLPVPGGYLTEIDDLIQIREHAGALSATWSSPGQWWGGWVIVGDTVVGARIRDPNEYVALGLLDGKPRWHVPIPDDAQSVEVQGDATAIVITRQRYMKMPPGDHDIHRILGVLDPKTGAERWSLELPYEPTEVESGSGGIALATEKKELVLYDITGHATTLPLRDRYPRLLVDGGIAYVTDREDNTITAYRIAGGTVLWRVHREVGYARLTLHDKLLVIGTERATVLALDRATGHVAWEIGTGIESKLFVGDHTVVTANREHAVGFVRPTTPPEPETATIRGRVKSVECNKVPGVPVRVGDQHVKADDDGRFTAQVRAVGVVMVSGWSSFSDNDDHPSSFALRLTGAGDYTIPDLELGLCDRE